MLTNLKSNGKIQSKCNKKYAQRVCNNNFWDFHWQVVLMLMYQSFFREILYSSTLRNHEVTR